MGARERWFQVMILVTEENDGARFMSRGTEETTETVSLEQAVRRYDKRRILRELEAAVEMVKKEVS